ncbi:hypothetical protein ACFPOU_08315 [Massilia jejuensis]|uniref:Uncharacterized protein n=1 Tax=Massilia jejuensis TaxID=648894 RepID=A0ABW0PEQ8_9BURK
MKQEEHTWDGASASGEDPSGDAPEVRRGRKDAGAAKSSTERGAAADKALIDAGGTIVSRLRLRPIAARALALLIEREDQTHGKQRAAIERALIEAAGGVEALEQMAAAEEAAAQAAAEAGALAQAKAQAAALAQAQRPRLSAIETELVALLEVKGPIHGTAQVGYALWPDREMQPQGAAIAAGGILRRLLDRAYIASALADNRRSYSVTASGIEAREQDRIDAIDPRQLTLLPAP